MNLPSKVKIVEVGPRDGLQNEKSVIPTEIKIELLDRLTRAGFANIEAASFVSPKWVPQMATSSAGEVRVNSVADVLRRMRDLGCDEIDIADTIGVGTARQVHSVFEQLGKTFPLERLSGHFHDTYGQALANIYAAMEAGISLFHSSVAGLGGCPYAKGATGNVATEDVLFLMNGLGIETGIDIDAVVDAGGFISAFLGRKSMSRTGNAISTKRGNLPNTEQTVR